MASPVTEQNQIQGKYDVTTRQFRDILKELCAKFNRLLKLGEQVNQLGKGEYLHYQNGTDIGRREFKSLASQFCKEITGLQPYFNQAKRPRRVARSGRTNNGFRNPMYVTSVIRDFFLKANLGPAFVLQEDDQGRSEWKQTDKPLNAYLSLLNQQITSAALLTPLFSIYAYVNNMQDLNNRQYLSATQEMCNFFGQTFTDMKNKDQATKVELQKQAQSGDKKAEADLAKLVVFDPSRFKYSRFQTIVALNRVPKSELTAEQQAALTNNQVKEALNNEQRLVSNTLTYYREATSDQRKAERAAKRRQKRTH